MHHADTTPNGASGPAGLRARAPVLVAAAVLLALALGAGVREWGAVTRAAQDGAAAPRFADGVPADRAWATTAGGDAPVAAASRGVRARARAPRITARAAALREAFEATPDLFAYSRSLAPAVRAGDAEATWLMSKVVDYCAGYGADPAGFARDSERFGDMGLRSSAAMAAARGRVGERCRRFTAADGLSPVLVHNLRIDAAGAGSLAAEAALMGAGQPLGEGDDYARGLVDRVRQSLDPDAYAAIAPAMGTMDARLGAHAGPDVAPQFRELVWQLAACGLGMDCGAESALMTSYCANGGICSNDATQGFEEFVYDAAVPRQSADVVSNMVDMLVVGTGGGI